jgi:hypothetical protein
MAARVAHVVVFVQENHTTDNYVRSMRPWGAHVATGWPTQPNPPARDQPHDRAAYARWLHAQQAGTPTRPLPPPPTATSAPVGPVRLRDGATLPPPNDQPVH